MPASKSKRARGKHYGNRVHHTGNKFILTSAEAQLIQAQIGALQQYIQTLAIGLHKRIVVLEPPVPEPATSPTEPLEPTSVAP